LVDKNVLIKSLEEKARILRKNIIEMIGVGHAGHVGGSMSCTDIIACLYFYKLNISSENFIQQDRNRFIMSKGHSVLAQYAALAELGFFPKSELVKTKTLKGILQGHPDRNKTPGIEANTGSLGQGLSIGCGLAIAMRLNKIERNVYILLGDGELAEGQVWEAAAAAKHYKLDHLVAIVDANNMGAVGFHKDRYCMEDIKAKFESFGWDAYVVDGHNMAELIRVLDTCDRSCGAPKVIVAHTTKGKGLNFAENNASYHNAALDEAQVQLAREAFGGEKKGVCV
jgi:transketolase